MGQKRVSDTLRQRAVFISAAGVRCVWLRHGLETFHKRLVALEQRVARTGEVLTEGQLKALEKAKEEKIAWGEIETEHVGYLGAQDTFYVGTLKGVGRIYQQSFIDTYSAVAFAKLYPSKHPIHSADLLNDQVLPFFDEHAIPLLRVLTDRGTEFCGRADAHDYELFLALNDIEHTRTKAKSPRPMGSTNGSRRRCSMSSIGWPSAARSMAVSRSCNRTWISGWLPTTMSARTRESAAKAGPR